MRSTRTIRPSVFQAPEVVHPAEEDGAHSSFLVSFDELDRRTDDGIRVHWRTFLAELWSDAFSW